MRPLPTAPSRRSAGVDPAADAAALLRRVGFATLMVVLPSLALVTRRGLVVLAPIGVALLVIASFLDGQHRPLRVTAWRLTASRAGLAAGLAALWCALSLVWTPFLSPAAERLFNIAATVGVAFAGVFALPDRMRSANLYLLPVGVGLAALVAIGVALVVPGARDGTDEAAQNLGRGLVVLALFVWPAVAWLRSRHRDLEALGLAVAVAFAAVLGPDAMPVIALGIGAAVYALVAAAPALGVRVTAAGMAGLLAVAPLLPFVGRPLSALILGPSHPITHSLAIWRRLVLSEPVRLITGHGFETALRGRFVGLLHPNAPSTLLLEVWYELGIVGALAGAVALWAAVRRAGREHPVLLPGITAAFATAYAFACLGIGTAQMWWFTALSLLVLVFVANERGQFRTTRPKAVLFNRVAANDR
ncbi:MAG TPA: peptide ABC transporter permease [Beijerinckiaceae bacterium]|jgi:hypothetical protein